MADARFEDAFEAPMFLGAEDQKDLVVVAAILQDAIFSRAQSSYSRKSRKFSLLLNRFRWEDVNAAKVQKRQFERVQSLLVISNVMQIKTVGLNLADKAAPLSLLTLQWLASEDSAGVITLSLAGGGGIAVFVETIGAQLRDVTRPYLAPSGLMPQHDI
ncbi:MAG: DUF2948 family protein [Paracoccaceae bacterium]|jgi:hypothetical protein